LKCWNCGKGFETGKRVSKHEFEFGQGSMPFDLVFCSKKCAIEGMNFLRMSGNVKIVGMESIS
jgi:hypothetical protein